MTKTKTKKIYTRKDIPEAQNIQAIIKQINNKDYGKIIFDYMKKSEKDLLECIDSLSKKEHTMGAWDTYYKLGAKKAMNIPGTLIKEFDPNPEHFNPNSGKDGPWNKIEAEIVSNYNEVISQQITGKHFFKEE